MDPINYSQGFQNPMDSFTGAFKVGGATLQQQTAADAAALARQQAEAEAKRQADIAARLKELSTNPSYDGYMQLSLMLDKDRGKLVQDAANSMKTEQKNAALTENMQIFSALDNGRADIAADLLRRQAEAARAAKNDAGAKYAETLATMVESGEEGVDSVKTMFGTETAVFPGGKDAMETYFKLKAEQRAQQEHPTLMAQKQAELDKAKTDAERLAIEVKYTDRLQQANLDKLAAETAKLNAEAFKLKLEGERPKGTEIDESARKLLNEATNAVLQADLVGSQVSNLSRAFDALKPPSGWGAKGAESLKKVLGGEDKFTQLKQEYVKLRNTEALRNLPPGPASDKDIEIALKAFPDDNANPELISSFLKGMAKLQKYSSDVNKAKAEWVNQNGSLGPAQMDFTAGGSPVKKGMPFWDFAKSIKLPVVVDAGPVPVDY